MKPHFLIHVVMAAAALVAERASAQLTINIGTVELHPNESGQTVDLMIQNSGAQVANIFGLNFALQVGDGTSGPQVTGVDLAASSSINPDQSSIFVPYAGNQQNQGSNPWIVFYGIDTGGGGITLAGTSSTILARITFDTSGISLGQGSWNLLLDGVSGEATQYVLVGGTARPLNSIFNGTIAIVPEPNAAAAVGGLLLLGALLWRWKRSVVACNKDYGETVSAR